MLFVTIVVAVTVAFLIWKYREHLVVFLLTHIRSLGAAVVFANFRNSLSKHTA